MKIIFAVLLCTFALASADDSNGLCKGKDPPHFIRDSKDCQAYFSCANDVGTRYKCPTDYLFDDDRKVCDKKENVSCGPTPEPNDCPEDEDLVYVPVPGECTKFKICVSGVGFEQECAPGLLFDENTKQCNSEHLVECNSCPFEDDPQHPMFLPNKYDCNKYYICLKREKHPFSCAKDLHFSEELNICTTPKVAECRFINNTVTTIAPPSTTIVTDPTVSTEEPTEPTEEPTEPTEEPTEPTEEPTEPTEKPTTGEPTEPTEDPTTELTESTTEEAVP